MSKRHSTNPLRRGRYRAYVLNHFNYRCNRCGHYGNLEIHHRKPLSEGGTHDLKNLEVVCTSCHMDEHKRHHTAGRQDWLDEINPRTGRRFSHA